MVLDIIPWPFSNFKSRPFPTGPLAVAVRNVPNGPRAASHETRTDTSTNERTAQNVNAHSLSRRITLFGRGRVESGAADKFHGGVKITRIINDPIRGKGKPTLVEKRHSLLNLLHERMLWNHFHKSLCSSSSPPSAPAPAPSVPFKMHRLELDGLAGCQPVLPQMTLLLEKHFRAKLSSDLKWLILYTSC